MGPNDIPSTIRSTFPYEFIIVDMNMIDTMSRTSQFCLIVFIGVLWRSYEMRSVETKKALELVCTYLWYCLLCCTRWF